MPKPPSHPLLTFWQFVAAKSLMCDTSNVYLQFILCLAQEMFPKNVRGGGRAAGEGVESERGIGQETGAGEAPDRYTDRRI